MYKHILKQFYIRKKEYLLLGLILSLSFFTFSVLFSFSYHYMVSAFSPRIPVNIDNCVELRFNWKKKMRWDTPCSVREEFRKRIVRLPNVVAADFVVNEMVHKNLRASCDVRTENTFMFYCGEQIPAVFNLKIEEGRWFADSNANTEIPQIIITRNHANFLGIKRLTEKNRYFKEKCSPKDSIKYEIVGVIEQLPMIESIRKEDQDRFPIFSSVESIGHRIRYYSDSESLVLRMKPGYSFDALNNQVTDVMDHLNFKDVTMSHQLISMEKRVQNQVKEHFADSKIVFLIIMTVLCYLLVTLFGSFFKIAGRRTVEIGIRRSIGHSRLQVMFYVLGEALLLYLICSLIVIVICIFFSGLNVLSFSSEVYVLSATLILFIILISSIIPAIRAARVTPVEALAEE